MNITHLLVATLLSAGLLPSEASAFQRRATFEAIVTSVGSSQPAPFATSPLAVGDPFRVEVGLPASGIAAGQGLTLYPVKPYVGGLRGNLPAVSVSVTADPGLLATSNDDPNGLDRVVYQQFLSTGDNVQIAINDATQTLFSTEDPLTQLGVFTIPGGANAQVFVEAAIGTPLITGTIVGFTIAEDDSIGIGFCEGFVNSTGASGALEAHGSARISQDNFRLEASQLPPGAAGFAISSMAQSFILPPSQNPFRLCLGGPFVNRHLDSIGAADANGRLTMPISLTDFPMGPQSSGPVLMGQTWNFQTWHRDTTGSNMTAGVSVTFE